ncbi:hypothetical protein [Tepidanaerobacter acetatoxydans]|uniref:hypothetical protein n=1 Tax=Tepidanaerobacter acetatoxydans TaxID=499229 RepID=UPI001BD1CC60|nr:hypothetical protein [Tepidanaerobacter acetatoxydans]
MKNIIFLILLMIFSNAIKRLGQPRKTKTFPTPKRPEKSKEYPLPPFQDFKPETSNISESRTIKMEADISSIPVEENSKDTITYDYTEPKQQLQPKSDIEISEFFSRENILRGIVFQEILSPPKALAHKQRRFYT